MTRRRPERRRDLLGLLGETPVDLSQANDIRALPVSDLRVGSAQPRRSFDLERLSELAESIRVHGVLQPLLVRSVDGEYEIVAGERRWRAAQLAGLTEVPVVVRQLSNEQARAAALIENLQRDNLNVIDEVDGKLELVALTLGLEREEARKRLMQLLRAVPGDEHEQLDQVFRSMGETWRTFAKNKLRILNWPQPVLEALRAGLPLTLGSVVASAPPERQAELLKLAQNGASRSQLLQALQTPSQTSAVTPEHFAKVLSSKRFLSGLDTPTREALDRWLARMPERVRQAIDEQS